MLTMGLRSCASDVEASSNRGCFASLQKPGTQQVLFHIASLLLGSNINSNSVDLDLRLPFLLILTGSSLLEPLDVTSAEREDLSQAPATGAQPPRLVFGRKEADRPERLDAQDLALVRDVHAGRQKRGSVGTRSNNEATRKTGLPLRVVTCVAALLEPRLLLGRSSANEELCCRTCGGVDLRRWPTTLSRREGTEL